MISEPDRYLKRSLVRARDIVTVHLESAGDTRAQVRRIRELGARPSVSIKPATPLSDVLPLLPELDMVLIMTVEPGFGGQGVHDADRPEIRELRRIIEERGYALRY